MDIYATYNGGGDFWPGVPARNLTLDEWAEVEAAYTPEEVEAIRALYTF